MAGVRDAGVLLIEWKRLPGFSIRHHRRRPRTGWVWEHSFDIEKHGSGHRFWLFKICHLKKPLSHAYTMQRLQVKQIPIWKKFITLVEMAYAATKEEITHSL